MRLQSEMKDGQYEAAAGILAGGKSSRMGENKLFLPWQGSTLLEHVLNQLSDFPQILVSVAKREEYIKLKRPGILLVEDRKKEYGPLEGLYQLVRHAEKDWVFILAADMPRVDRRLIQEMLGAKRQGVQAVVLKEGARVQPLCGLYHKSILPVLEELFEAECHSMQQLLQRITVGYLSLKEETTVQNMLVNINTPEDYKRLLSETVDKEQITKIPDGYLKEEPLDIRRMKGEKECEQQ